MLVGQTHLYDLEIPYDLICLDTRSARFQVVWNNRLHKRLSQVYNERFVQTYTPLFHKPEDPLDWVVE